MSSTGQGPLPRRNSKPVFRPRFMLSLLYLTAFFFFFCFVLAAPELVAFMRDLPPGPEHEQQELLAQVMKDAVQPRLPIAVALTLCSLGVLGYYQRLPGMRS